MNLDRRRLCAISCVLLTVLSLILPITLSSAQDDVVPFIVATSSGPGKFDPLDAYDSESIETIIQVVEGLYIYNYSSREMEAVPCLAADMGTWSLDGSGNLTILTVPLKSGVTFHTGEKFNASSVKWNFDRLQYWTYGFDIDGGNIYTSGDGDLEQHYLGTASKTLFQQTGIPILNHTEIVDEYTIAFHLNLESVIWEKLMAFVACSIVLPDMDYVYGSTFGNRIDINDELIGTGPFILTEYDIYNQVVFDYNPDYHMAWGGDHIVRMIYRIIPDSVTETLAFLNFEVHWGQIDSNYDSHFPSYPDLVDLPCKRAVVYFMQMNLYTMKWEYRYASSFIWNHTYFLQEVLGGMHYELHVPVPDGMQYHHEGFQGEPHHDYTIAQEILLNSPDVEIQTNLTLNGLTASSSREEWRTVAESTTPIAIFNYTRYESSLVELCGILLQDYLKDIGVKLVVLDAISWEEWNNYDYFENPEGHKRFAFSFGGWGPDYNDPINMIEPLYGTNASSNCFMLNNDTWNDKLIATYSSTEITSPTRQELFYEIQEDFCKIHVPSFYLLQLGGFISFNRDYLDQDSVGDLLNIFGYLYWFNCKFTPPPNENSPLFLILGIPALIAIGFALIFTVRAVKKRAVHKKPHISLASKVATYCSECGAKHDEKSKICEYCGKIHDKREVRKHVDTYDPQIPKSAIKFCPFCGTLTKDHKCIKCEKDFSKQR